MGGIVCSIPWKAKVRFDEFPKDPTHKEMKDIEAQIREALLVPVVYESVVERGHGVDVCELLERSNLSEAELRRLYDMAKPPY